MMTPADALRELDERLAKAEQELEVLRRAAAGSNRQRDQERRLAGKKEGVVLARGYLRELQRVVDGTRSDG